MADAQGDEPHQPSTTDASSGQLASVSVDGPQTSTDATGNVSPAAKAVESKDTAMSGTEDQQDLAAGAATGGPAGGSAGAASPQSTPQKAAASAINGTSPAASSPNPPEQQIPAKPAAHGAPVRQYLNTKVTGVLLEGMKKLAIDMPDNPLKVLGEFLIEKSKEYEGNS